MNTRQKIFALFKEGKTPDEIIELLKDEKVSNIRSYVSRVKRDLNSPTMKGKERVDKRLRKAGLSKRNQVICKCVNCGAEYDIHTSKKDMYDMPMVKENWCCVNCMYKVKRVLIERKCACGRTFKTKVLPKNKDKYTEDFKCEVCI
jgi:hypothetical protein